ncbi:MAG TPA: hypothetical protein VD713_06270, partial [Sphingomonadales bacterium]|nr:hypothetical protein [Sphingomonadales bacterium]
MQRKTVKALMPNGACLHGGRSAAAKFPLKGFFKAPTLRQSASGGEKTMRQVVIALSVFFMAGLFWSLPAAAKNYRVIGQSGLWDSTSYLIKCDNGKERYITLDKK